MEWIYLGVAIAARGRLDASPLRWPRPAAAAGTPLVVTGYVASFVLLSLALDAGMGIGVAYGIWTAVGVAFTAVLSRHSSTNPSPARWSSASC